MKDRLLTIGLSVATTMGLMQATPERQRELEVDRLIVRQELIVSDTGEPWEKGYESHQIPRGVYARALHDGPGGLWVRSRLIKGEIDDPFDDRFHALESNGSRRGTPGHISWNMWADGAWRQMVIIQGEALENSEIEEQQWSGGTHPGRLRFESFRPEHGEPLTDVIIGQGKVSIGGGGYGGGGLPYPQDVLELWGGEIQQHPVGMPNAPTVLGDDGTGLREYALIAVGPNNHQTAASRPTNANGLAKLKWDSVVGADAYIVVRDGKPITGPIRIEGSEKIWVDNLK